MPELEHHPVLPAQAGWRNWTRDAAEGASCAVDYVALPLLAAAGALIGNARWGASPN
jgi:hypothetical protein